MDRETMETMDPSQGEKTTIYGETMDPSQGKKTTIYGETMEPPEGVRIIAEAERFLQGYFKVNWADMAKMYREDSGMKFDGKNIQGKEAIRAKFSSLKLSRIQVPNIKCLPVGGTGLDGGTGFSSGLQGMACGYIWPDGKQDARLFSQSFILHPTPEGSFAISNSIFYTGPKSSESASASSNIFHTGHKS